MHAPSRSSPLRRACLGIAIGVGSAVALMASGCSAPALESVTPKAPTSFDPALVARGSQLAAIGNCAGCHTTADGKPFAGGLPLDTPFGKIYSTNITPDAQSGIGAWSRAAFVRAMRDGIARDGTHLYPAFPYDHFTKVADTDLDALYAYVMTRDAVPVQNHANALHFPFSIRPLVAGWNALFLDSKSVANDATQSAEWNRGAYLVDALGHCASCHTPRNAMGAEKSGAAFNGGEVDGWYAPALNSRSPSPVPWTVEQLTTYLRTGIAADHAIAGGPMQGVVHALADVNEQDVRAIATYVMASMGPADSIRQARTESALKTAAAGPLALSSPATGTGDPAQLKLGAMVYRDTCASCHDQGRQASSMGALQMPFAIAVHDPDPLSLIRIIEGGIQPVLGDQGRWMPDFGNTLTDGQLTALVAWLRQAAAPEAEPWPDLSRRVQEARQP